MTSENGSNGRSRTREQRESVTIRFAGDSGDGMQLAGTRFTDTSALLGNDIATFPDFPAEIRAPAGTLPGVSGFQVHFSSQVIYTPGDVLNTLVVMNPAALKTNIKDREHGGVPGRDVRRVEGELERAFGTRPDRDALHLELGRGTFEVDVEPTFGENASLLNVLTPNVR